MLPNILPHRANQLSPLPCNVIELTLWLVSAQEVRQQGSKEEVDDELFAWVGQAYACSETKRS